MMSNTLTGTPASENLSGTTVDDMILGLEGDDTLSAGAGNDTLDGGGALTEPSTADFLPPISCRGAPTDCGR